MNRNTFLAVAAAALSVSATFSAPASANGIRLGFGGPLGSFVARPTPGYGGGTYASSEKHCKKPAARVARSSKPSYTPERKVASKPVSKPRTEVAESRKHKAEPVKVARAEPVARKSVEDTNSALIAPVTGSTALAQISGTQSSPAPETADTAEPKTDEVATIIDTNATETPATGTEADAPAETQKTEEPKADEKPTKTASAETGSDDSDCKRFIPIIGITVSVGCGK